MVWDHSARTGGHFKLKDNGGTAPKTARRDVFDNGASFVQQGEKYQTQICVAQFNLMSRGLCMVGKYSDFISCTYKKVTLT